MKPGASWSLRRRLSMWLAIQTLLGLVLVSAAVYIATASSLATQEAELLAQKQAVVTHLLAEARHDGDLLNLKHRLDDFFVGRTDLALELSAQDGASIYRSPHDQVTAKRVRSVQFSLPSPTGAVVDVTAQLSLDTRADDELLRRLTLTLAAAALFGALLVSAGGFLLVRSGLAPVQQLVNQTKNLAAATLDRRLDGSAQPEELQPLVEQFNALFERLGQAYEQLEDFNVNVAHELNTPLATIITSTELALRKERDPEALRDMLGSNLEELHRMSGIVKDMLFLSHAERGARARRAHVPSLAVVASDVTDYHEAVMLDVEVGIEIVGDIAGEFDMSLIKRAISNLLGNAIRYADRGSTIRIEIAPHDVGMARLAVVNRGPPIAAEHLPRLFLRFYRADPSRTQSDANHGLGLSIVAAIAQMHGGLPFVESGNDQTTIGIIVPIAGDRS